MSQEVEMVSQLVSIYRELENKLSRLTNYLLGQSLPATSGLIEKAAIKDIRRELIKGFQDIWYDDDRDGRETRRYPGIIATDMKGFELATEANQIKHVFAQAVRSFERNHSLRWAEAEDALREAAGETFRDRLRRTGLSRLHRRQAARQIVLLDPVPESIAFTWSGKPSIKRITVREAEELLDNLVNEQAAHIAVQRERLARLRPDTPLAQVQQLRPSLFANIGWVQSDGALIRRKRIASLPFLISIRDESEWPRIGRQPSAPTQVVGARLQRRDKRIKDDPYLPSIRVHLYDETIAV